MNTNCVKGKKFTSSRLLCIGAAKLKYLLLFLVIFIGCLNGRIIYTWGSGTNDFKKYINNANYNYENVLVLGVGADWEAAVDLMNKYDFDLVIPVSRDGNKVEDSVMAAIEKLGIRTGTLGDIKGKNINNLFAHSWGSSRAINTIATNDTIRVKNLHAIGSPHSILWSSLGESIDRGKINKVYFHVNEGDNISGIFKNFPSALGGKFTSRIEIHDYTTKSNSVGTIIKEPLIGFKKYEHYNCPGKGHGLEDEYFKNMSFALNRDPQHSPFNGSIPPFYKVPSYWVSGGAGQSLTAANTVTGMVHNKNKSLIVGSGSEAELMYNNVVKKMGKENVYWLKNTPANEKLLQKEARTFGADVILGVRTNNSNLPDHNINSFPEPKIKQPDEIYKRAARGPFPPPPGGPGGGAANVGGVCNNPEPVSNGKGGSETKKKVLESRPSGDSLTWTSDSAGE